MAADSVQTMVELAQGMDAKSRGKYISDLVNSKDSSGTLAGRILFLSDLINKDKIEGKKQLDRLFPEDGKLQAIDPYAALTIAVMRDQVGDSQRATTIIDRIGNLTTKPRDRILSAEAMADVRAQQDEYADAEKWYRDAMDGLAAYDISNVEIPWKDRLNRKLAILRGKQEEKTLGKAYVLYRSARDLQANEKFTDAQKNFERLMGDQSEALWDKPSAPIKPLLQCAARFERLKCMAEAADLSIAAKESSVILPEMMGPWAGSFLVLRGELILFSSGDPEKARDSFVKAMQWTEAQRKSPHAEAGWEIPAYMQDATAPPRDMYTSSGLGNVNPSVPAPGAIFNQFTCAWYLDWISINATSRMAICEFLRGDIKEAVGNLKLMNRFDSRDRQVALSGMPSNYRRLADDFATGGLFATKDELSLFPKKILPELIIAELDHEMERWPEAEKGYHRFLRKYGNDLTPNASAYIYLPLYMCRAYQMDRVGAEKLLREMIRKYPNAPSIPRAKLELASVITSPTEQMQIVREVVANYPDSEWSVKAYFTLATYLRQDSKYDESIKVINALLKVNHDPDVIERAQHFFKSIENFRSGNIEHLP